MPLKNWALRRRIAQFWKDSPHGIKGAREAGMRAIGFTGGSHLEGRRDTHAAILKEAGAAEVITTLGEAYEALLAG